MIDGALAGFAAGLVVAAVATVLDWRLNPGGLFHGDGGSNWAVILDTLWGWFWPVAAVVGSFVAAVLWFRRRS